MDRNPYQYHHPQHGPSPPSLHGNIYPYPPYVVQPASMGAMLHQAHQTAQLQQPQFHVHPHPAAVLQQQQQQQQQQSHLQPSHLHNPTAQRVNAGPVSHHNPIHLCPPSITDGSGDNYNAPHQSNDSSTNSVLLKQKEVVDVVEGLDKEQTAHYNVDVRAVQKVSKPKYEMQWRDMFHRLKLYKEVKGDTLVPQNYEEDPPLGKWVNTQRRQYKLHASGRHSLITPERIELLNDEGFVWDASAISRFTKDNLQWQQMYKTLFKYYKENGHCRVPRGYAKNRKLATWVNNQRSQHKRMVEGKTSSMNQQKIQQLEEIGFDWAKAKKVKSDNSPDELYDENHHLQQVNALPVTAHQSNDAGSGQKETSQIAPLSKSLETDDESSTNASISRVAFNEGGIIFTESTRTSFLKNKDGVAKSVEPKPCSSKMVFPSGLPTRERLKYDDTLTSQAAGNVNRIVCKESVDTSVGVHEDISFLASSLLEMKNHVL